MKKLKTSKMELLKFVIFVICIIGFFLLKKVSSNETDKIFKNGEYSIGRLLEFYKGNSTLFAPNTVNQPSNTPYVRYKYSVNNIEFICRYDANTYNIPTKGIKEGKNYLVVYNKKDPQKSRILFDYIINDSIDFKKSIKKFEQKSIQKAK